MNNIFLQITVTERIHHKAARLAALRPGSKDELRTRHDGQDACRDEKEKAGDWEGNFQLPFLLVLGQSWAYENFNLPSRLKCKLILDYKSLFFPACLTLQKLRSSAFCSVNS